MKCDNCGYLLLDGDNFCRNCGKTININQSIATEQNIVNNISKNDNKKANRLCIYSLLLYFVAPIIFLLFDIIIALLIQNNSMIGISGFSIISRIAGFVLMIIAKVKYPKNLFATILMWVYIGLIAAGFIMGIIAVLLIILLLLSIS